MKEVLEHGRLGGQQIRGKAVKVATFGVVLAAPKTLSALLASPAPSVRAAAVAAMQAAEAPT